MAPPPFLDTNILLRHLLNDHPDHSPRATAHIARIERGEVQARTGITVVFEAVYVLERTLRRPKTLIRDGILTVLDLPGIIYPGKQHLRRAFALYVDHNLPFTNAYHAVLALDQSGGEIVSFDRHFDRLPGLRRTEPER